MLERSHAMIFLRNLGLALGRWESLGGVWLIIAIVVFVPAILFGGMRTLDALDTQPRNDLIGTRIAVETLEDFHKTLLAVAEFRLQPDTAMLDRLRSRFDMFVSDIAKIDADARQAVEVQPVLEQELARVLPGQPQSIEPFRHKLDSLEQPLAQMVRSLLAEDDLRARTQTFPVTLLFVLVAFVLAATAGIGFFSAKLLTARRAMQLHARQFHDRQFHDRHQSDRMRSIGRIAGGVAHDFNNILAAISGFTALLEIDLGDRPKQLHMLRQIATAAKRGKDLVQSIMSFGRAEQAERLPIDAGDICRAAATTVGASISGPAKFDVDIEEGPLPILGNLAQIDSAVVNLCINALDALTAGRGKVRLEVRRVPIDGRRHADMKGNAILSPGELPVVVDQADANRTRMLVGFLGEAPADYLRIRVVDDGCGMSEDIMRHMFEPFFTTKNVGQGTGLGLSSVLGIVSAHGGAIAVDSTLGKGTIFDLLLPLLPAQEATETAAPAAGSQQWPYGGLHILLVDDDPLAREALDLTLQSLGCETAACDSGEEALALMHDEPGLFDLVISDYLMPNMNGIELAARLRERGFRQPIVITSGRIQDIAMTDRARLNIGGLLPKPYSLREVGELVGRIAQLKRGPLGDPTPSQATPLPPRKAQMR
jgi:signal transduction histidine kinase